MCLPVIVILHADFYSNPHLIITYLGRYIPYTPFVASLASRTPPPRRTFEFPRGNRIDKGFIPNKPKKQKQNWYFGGKAVIYNIQVGSKAEELARLPYAFQSTWSNQNDKKTLPQKNIQQQ